MPTPEAAACGRSRLAPCRMGVATFVDPGPSPAAGEGRGWAGPGSPGSRTGTVYTERAPRGQTLGCRGRGRPDRSVLGGPVRTTCGRPSADRAPAREEMLFVLEGARGSAAGRTESRPARLDSNIPRALERAVERTHQPSAAVVTSRPRRVCVGTADDSGPGRPRHAGRGGRRVRGGSARTLRRPAGTTNRRPRRGGQGRGAQVGGRQRTAGRRRYRADRGAGAPAARIGAAIAFTPDVVLPRRPERSRGSRDQRKIRRLQKREIGVIVVLGLRRQAGLPRSVPVAGSSV